MSLKEKIDTDIKSAMKAKDQASLRALRAIKSAILLAETEEGRQGKALTEAEEMKLLIKQAKQRRDSHEQYAANNRLDLAKIEAEELAVIENYLPKQLSPEELETEVKAILEQTGATSMKDMGKVMGMANKKLAGKTDGKAIAAVVKKLLA